MGERSYRLQPVTVKGTVVRRCDSSFLFFDETNTALYYVPFSRIIDWKYLGSRHSIGLEMHHLDEDDPVQFDLPYWLVAKEAKL